MPDGPFRNQEISSRAKNFADAVCSECESVERCTALAGHAILGMLKESRQLILALRTWASNIQLRLDAEAVVERIFAGHPSSQFGNTLQRELLFRLSQGQAELVAFENGLRSACSEYKMSFRDRLEDEGLKVFHKGRLTEEGYAQFKVKSGDAISRLDDVRIFDAVRNGLESTFALEAKKKDGVDDGPL